MYTKLSSMQCMLYMYMYIPYVYMYGIYRYKKQMVASINGIAANNLGFLISFLMVSYNYNKSCLKSIDTKWARLKSNTGTIITVIYIADVLVRIINTYIHIPVVLFNQQLALNLCDFDYIHVTFTLGQSNHIHCTA